MKVRLGPFWYDRVPQHRRPAYPRQRSNIESRVAIIGGGLTGCACACVLAAARIPVVLLEADRIGRGATGGDLGIVREDFDVAFADAAATHGVRAARTLWQGMRRASLDFAAALRRLQIRCELTPQDLVSLAAADPAAARRHRRDYEARRAAGLEHSWLTPQQAMRETAIAAGGGIRTRGATLDPYRACLGLAAAAAARGAAIFESSGVRRLRAGRKGVELVTAGGSICVDTVIVTASLSVPELRQLRRHLAPRDSYAAITEPLPAPVRRELGQRAASIRDWGRPPHFIRWLKDDRVLIAGADQPRVAPRGREPAVVQRTGQLMYELSLLYPPISGAQAEHAWICSFDDTADGLPYIGTHRNFPHHLFALGLGRHGAAGAWLAARLVLRHVTGEPAKGDDLFGFSRILQPH
jgi:glycine/D-amino acid oxidase-like deaminating enzyme